MVHGWVYHVAYPMRVRPGRDVLPHHIRDAEAANFMTSLLVKRGYDFWGPILNYPSPGPALIPYDCSRFREQDILLLVTRPPIHDRQLGDRKGIARSYTTLEQRLFDGPLAQNFALVARSQIQLNDDTAAISPEVGRRQSVLFRQNGGAMYDAYGPVDPSRRDEWTKFRERPPLTAAYLVYAEHAWPGGPAFLAAFAPGGTETLVWCRKLATTLADLVCATSFAMAEIRTAPVPALPQGMEFADDWDVKILGVAAPLPAGGPKKAA